MSKVISYRLGRKDGVLILNTKEVIEYYIDRGHVSTQGSDFIVSLFLHFCHLPN